MIQRTYQTMLIQEAKGNIPQGSAFQLTLAIAMESAAAAFHKSYYGDEQWAKAAESIRTDEKQGAELMGRTTEAFLSDISSTQSVLKRHMREAHVTTDFAGVLGTVRQRTLREGYTYADSVLAGMADQRPVSNFRTLEGVTIGNFDDLSEQAEAEDVEYATIDYTEDGYRISMRSKAFRFTYQMWKNDDIGLINRAMKKGGAAARRSRHLVVAQALLEGGVTPIAGNGLGVERLKAIRQFQANLKDAQGKATPRRITNILAPLQAESDLLVTLGSEKLNVTSDKAPTANPVYKMADATFDEIWSEVAGDKVLFYNRGSELVEMAVLDDFRAGPLTITQLPDVGEHADMGAFSNNVLAVKFCDAVGAKKTPEGAKNGLLVQL